MTLISACGSDEPPPGPPAIKQVLITQEDPLVLATTDQGITQTALQLGHAKYLFAAAYDSSDVIVLDSEILWESSNATVASVDSNGLLRGLAVGEALLTASVGGVASEPLNVSIVVLGGRGGAIADRIDVMVIDSATDHPIEGARVGIGEGPASTYRVNRFFTTDASGRTTIPLESTQSGRPHDLHLLASGYATRSIYSVDNNSWVIDLTPFVSNTGSMSGEVFGLGNAFGHANALGINAPVRSSGLYVFPDSLAISPNGASAPVPTLPMSTGLIGTSLLGFGCGATPQMVRFASTVGLGPIDPVHTITQDFDLSITPTFTRTQGDITIPSGFSASDLYEVLGFSFFGDQGIVNSGMDVAVHCNRFGLSTVADRTKYKLDAVAIPGATYHWIQARTNPSRTVTRQRGFSLIRATNLSSYPPVQNLTLMNLPTQINPPGSDVIFGTPVGTAPLLTWTNSTTRNTEYFEVLLSDAGPVIGQRGRFFWKITYPGAVAFDAFGNPPLVELPLPRFPKGLPADSGFITEGNLVAWSVYAYDVSGFIYDLQNPGILLGYAFTPDRLFRP